MPYFTPESLPTEYRCRRLRIPDGVDWLSIVNGALAQLTYPYNFEKLNESDLTPELTAETFTMMFLEYMEGEACLIGSILLYATADTPSGTLLCDGSTYLRTDYPRLYGVLDSQYIVDADHFVTPNPPSYVGLNYFIVAK